MNLALLGSKYHNNSSIEHFTPIARLQGETASNILPVEASPKIEPNATMVPKYQKNCAVCYTNLKLTNAINRVNQPPGNGAKEFFIGIATCGFNMPCCNNACNCGSLNGPGVIIVLVGILAIAVIVLAIMAIGAILLLSTFIAVWVITKDDESRLMTTSLVNDFMVYSSKELYESENIKTNKKEIDKLIKDSELIKSLDRLRKEHFIFTHIKSDDKKLKHHQDKVEELTKKIFERFFVKLDTIFVEDSKDQLAERKSSYLEHLSTKRDDNFVSTILFNGPLFFKGATVSNGNKSFINSIFSGIDKYIEETNLDKQDDFPFKLSTDKERDSYTCEIEMQEFFFRESVL